MKPYAGLAFWGRIALFFVVIALLGWFSNIDPGRRIMVKPATKASVLASRMLINAFGGNARSEETLLDGPNMGLEIKDGCNGVIAMILFAGAVVAHETTAVAKLLGLAIGLPAIWAVNVLRIVGLYVVSVVAPSHLEFFHVYFFQTLIIICVAIIWYVWAMRSLHYEPGAGRIRPAIPGPDGESPDA